MMKFTSWDGDDASNVMFWGEVSNQKKRRHENPSIFDEFCSSQVLLWHWKNATNVTNVTSNVTSAEMVLKEAEAQADEKRRWKLELALAMSIIETTANDTGTGTVVVNLRLAKTKTHKKKNMFFLSGAGFHPRWFSGNPLVIVTASLEINPALNVNFPALNLIHKFCCCGSCMFPKHLWDGTLHNPLRLWKLTCWTQKWRFGRWFSFSIWWFLGSRRLFSSKISIIFKSKPFRRASMQWCRCSPLWLVEMAIWRQKWKRTPCKWQSREHWQP